MDKTEDQTAPVSQAEIASAIKDDDQDKLYQLVDRVLRAINEKRDSYNGVTNSIIYIIESSHDGSLIRLRNGLLDYLTQRPMSFAGKTFLTKALYRLISDQPCFVQDLFEYIIMSSNSWEQRILPDECQVLKIKITALKAIKQAEHSKFGRPTNLPPEYINKLCSDSIEKGDNATKIDTLSLILESRSTTKVLDDNELSVYKAIFTDAICLQDAALRQVFIALTNKVLKRLKDSYKVVIRDGKRFSDTDREVIILRYKEFINWLINKCLDSNYCNAYFGSFVLTISTLKLILQHITPSEERLYVDHIDDLLKRRRSYDSILSCLSDSFEENKGLASNLLLSLPYNENFFSDTNVETFRSIAYYLIDSINPAHSLTCQYVFKLLIDLESKRARHTGCADITKNRLLLKNLNNLLDQIEGSVKSFEDNFTVALKGKPVYPKLTCIRSLLEEVNIEELEADRQQWIDLCRRIVGISIDACQAVSTIVCNLNPETIGHLPMDLKPVDPESLAKSFNISISKSDSDYTTVTSQMLLISGWKTIKECSLSLGTLCIRFWWPKDGIKKKKEKFPGLGTEPILARNDILKILDFFNHYLRNLRHRGAFEQAYNGFIMVTQRIWHDHNFREQLFIKLGEIMDDIQTDNSNSSVKADYLKAYVTRRSAGLPFVVQAILISEHKQESFVLDYLVGRLFIVLNRSDSEEYQRIHCMNILRAVIKEHNLGEKVLRHVGETMSITLKAFRSDSFPIRNCANMLLKAVVDRTFGVNRLKDEIHRRNQLSFEKFFVEFPRLFYEMIEYLDTDVNDKRYIPSIYSVLIVLSRLKASTSPGPDYTYDKVIKPFIYSTMKWTLDCPDYKLRQAAAKICIQLCNYSMLQISPPVNVEELEVYLLENLRFQSDGLNRSHGRLTAARFLIESDSNLFHQMEHSIAKILEEGGELFTSMEQHSSVRLNYMAALESWYIVKPDRVGIFEQFKFLNSPKSYIQDLASDKNPLAEQALFRFISSLMLESVNKPQINMSMINTDIATVVFGSAMRNCTLNLQAALIRLLRELYSGNQDIIDEIHSVLDLDPTAVHETLFDRLKYRKDEGLECAKLEAYLIRIKQAASSLNRKYIQLVSPYIEKLTDFSQFDEFKPITVRNNLCQFSTKSSNTPRSIELLAYACGTRGFQDLGRSIVWQRANETQTEKLKFIREFITNLKDCDVKSLAIVLAGQIIQQSCLEDSCATELDLFGSLINELAGDNHSFVVRKACCYFLQTTFTKLVESRSDINVSSLVKFISTIIKLSKDSESEIRSLSSKIVESLNRFEDCHDNLQLYGSRLDPLVRLIILGSMFQLDDVEHANQVLELLCQIIFDHGTNDFRKDEDEEERLFDKTKLNTFADQIAATQSAVSCMNVYFGRILGRSISLNSFRIPSAILAELEFGLGVSKHSQGYGDYSWRGKQMNASYQHHSRGELVKNFDQIIEELLQGIIDSLQYFTKGYWNILTDSEYIYHELSLFRRLEFVSFVLDSTEYNPEYKKHLYKIRTELKRIVESSCATTILTKCIESLNRLE